MRRLLRLARRGAASVARLDARATRSDAAADSGRYVVEARRNSLRCQLAIVAMNQDDPAEWMDDMEQHIAMQAPIRIDKITITIESEDPRLAGFSMPKISGPRSLAEMFDAVRDQLLADLGAREAIGGEVEIADQTRSVPSSL